MHIKYSYSVWLRIASILMLMIAIGDWPWAYYALLRIVVFSTAASFSYQLILIKKNTFIFWLIVAIVFNPVFPISLDKFTWTILDLLMLGVFVATFISSRLDPFRQALSNTNGSDQSPISTDGRVAIPGIEECLGIIFEFQEECINKSHELPWLKDQNSRPLVWQEYLIFMNFSLDAVLERKGASMPRRTIVRELCKTTFVTNVDEHMDRVVASNFHDKRYSHYGEIKARDPRTGNTSVLEAFIALSLESIAHKKPWYGEVSKDTIIRSNKYFKQVAKARLEDKVDLIHYNIVNAFANKLMVIDMGNFWPQSVATNPEVPITPSTVTNEEGLINNALAELALHCAKKTKELPWVQGSEDVSVIAQTEFLLYCYFVLDVTCYMKKAAVSTRRELTRLIEEYLEKNITKLGDWDQKYSIRELRDHRDKYYTGLFSNDKDWLIKSIECFTSISIESISNGVFFMKSGNVISTNPILTMEAYTMLTEDVINDGDILPIKLIFNSAEKIVKANKPT